MRNKFAKVSDPNKFVTESGDIYHIEYSPKINSDGTIDLVECGKTNIQEYIDSFKESTDMTFIIKQLSLGNTSVLNQKTPLYGDFTDMPKTYAEALQMVIDAEKAFYKLPADIRNNFDNDYMQWFAQAGSEDFIKKMGIVTEPVSAAVENVDEGEKE